MFSVFFVVVHVSKKEKRWIGVWVSGVWPIRVFLGFFDFFNLTRPLRLIRPDCRLKRIGIGLEYRSGQMFVNIESLRVDGEETIYFFET